MDWIARSRRPLRRLLTRATGAAKDRSGALALVVEALRDGRLPAAPSRLDAALLCAEAHAILERGDPEAQARGAHPTPAALARRLAAEAFEALDPPADARLRVFDSSCGGGMLLLAALEQLRARGLAGAATLSGCDASPQAIAAARFAFAQAGCEARLELTVGDGLTGSPAAGSPAADLVLGNPPWGSFSGRHRQRGPAASNGAGWPSLHGAFLVAMAEAVAPGGVLAALCPSQVLDLDGYAPVRAALTARLGPPRRAEDLGEELFEGVTSPVAALVFRAPASGANAQEVAPGDGAPWLAGAAALEELPRWPAAAFADIGVHTGNAASLVLAPAGEGEALREGRCVHAFRLDPPSRGLRRDAPLPDGRSFRAHALERYAAVPILLRQTAARPVAARHDPAAAFRNSALACYGLPGWPPEVALGILNSELIASVHQRRFRDARQRRFPQLKMKHLRALPAPHASRRSATITARIVALVRQLEAEGDARGPRAALEQAVRALYGLS